MAHGVPTLRNPWSLTIVFPQPAETIVARYQLACNDGQAHAIVMPSVTDELIGRFASDYSSWWRSTTSHGQ
jgi:serine decarboxylase